MRRTAMICLVLAIALATALAGTGTEKAPPAGGSTDPAIRVGDCGSGGPATVDPRLTSRGGPNAGLASILRDPPCELGCNACWYEEGEGPTPDEYVDSYNGGCNSSPEAFWDVTPQYGPLTICGKGGNYQYSGMNYRDTDWYELTMTQTREITATCIAEFPVELHIIDGNSGCASHTIVTTDTQPECVEASVTYQCTAGTWWVWVGCADFTGWPNDADYQLTIHEYDYECSTDCPQDGDPEGEPPLEVDYEDQLNGGCNSSPYVFQPIAPSPSTIIVCGEGGMYDYFGTCYRDTDWFEIELDESREITTCLTAEFPYQFLIADVAPDCGTIDVIESVNGDVCTEECITQTLSPGRYIIFAAAQFGYSVHPGLRYVMSIDGYTTPVEGRSWGTIKSLYR